MQDDTLTADGFCTRCGRSHDRDTRIATLKRMHCLPREIIQAWECWYGPVVTGRVVGKTAGYRKLMRDLALLRVSST